MNVKINMNVNFPQVTCSLGLLEAVGELAVFEQECLFLGSWVAEAWGERKLI